MSKKMIFLKLLLVITNLCNLPVFANKLVCTVLTLNAIVYQMAPIGKVAAWGLYIIFQRFRQKRKKIMRIDFYVRRIHRWLHNFKVIRCKRSGTTFRTEGHNDIGPNCTIWLLFSAMQQLNFVLKKISYNLAGIKIMIVFYCNHII